MDRKLIRKYILLEMKKRISEQAEEPSSESKEKPAFPSPEAAQQAKELLEQTAAAFAGGVKKGSGVGLSEAEANEIADALYDATEGWSLSLSDMASGKFGAIGTNEAAIIENINKIPSLADLSFVAHKYEKRHSGYNLAETLEEEYGSFSATEFDDVKTAIQSIYTDKAILFLDGKAITKVELDNMMAAVKRNSAEIAAGAKATDNIDVSGALAGAGLGLAGGTAATFGFGAGMGVIAASSIGILGHIGVGAAAASGMGTMAAVLGSNPAGWAVALGIVAVGTGVYAATDRGELDSAQLAMLNPEFYRKLVTMFPQLADSFSKRAGEIDPEDYAVAEGGEYPPLAWGLDKPYLKHIILTMNAYASTRKLEGYTPCSGEEWTPEVQNCWTKFAPHALENCDVFSAHKDKAGISSSWPALSRGLSPDFPAYYPNPRGCLAFCLDAYYCEIRYGNAVGGDAPAPTAPATTEREPETRRSKGGGDRSLSKVQIRLSTTGRNFKDSGFKLANGEDPDAVIKTNLINLLDKNAQNRGIAQTTLKFYAEVRGNRVVDMERMGWDGSARDWVARKNTINSEVKTVLDGGNLVIPDGFKFNKGRKGKGPKTINFSVVFRAGSY